MQDEMHSDHPFIAMLSDYILHNNGATMREINGH
jgi:hypothetical protein